MIDQKVKFNSTLLLAGKTATGVQVPNEIVEKIGAGKRPAVKVTINGYTYPNTIAVMNGIFMLAVNATVREKAGILSKWNWNWMLFHVRLLFLKTLKRH